MNIKNILLVAFGGTGNECEAIRHILVYFNYFVAIKYIGRPNDFIDLLFGYFNMETIKRK